MNNNCCGLSELAASKPFAVRSRSTLTPYFFATLASVSPGCTAWYVAESDSFGNRKTESAGTCSSSAALGVSAELRVGSPVDSAGTTGCTIGGEMMAVERPGSTIERPQPMSSSKQVVKQRVENI